MGAGHIRTARASADQDNTIQVIWLEVLHANVAGRAFFKVKQMAFADDEPFNESLGFYVGTGVEITQVNVISFAGAALPIGTIWHLCCE